VKIAFATTQNTSGSTVIGRITPIVSLLSKQHSVHLLLLGTQPNKTNNSNLHYHSVGQEPFKRTSSGKRRLGGIRLIARLKLNAFLTTVALFKINPDVVVIVKSLPHNVAGVWLWHLFNPNKKIILDVDDFELTANVLTSLTQRAAIHWAERTSAKISNIIVTATPFLTDHFKQLTNNKKEVVMIPTGINSITTQPLPTSPTLLYIGSVSISSGHHVDLLPNILKLVRIKQPNAKMIIAGSGDNISKIKEQFKKLNLSQNVTFTGRFTSQEIPELLSQTSVIIDPIDSSISARAKSSFRVALAGSTGTPIVTSDIGIRPYFLPAKLHNKFFAKPANSKDYANKTIELLNQPLTNNERELMIQKSQEYSWEKLANKYKKIIS
jgi:glycosyltransferase involved in cell wall biosynthesis